MVQLGLPTQEKDVGAFKDPLATSSLEDNSSKLNGGNAISLPETGHSPAEESRMIIFEWLDALSAMPRFEFSVRFIETDLIQRIVRLLSELELSNVENVLSRFTKI